MSEPQVRHDLGTVFIDVGKVSGKDSIIGKVPEGSSFESTCLRDALKREARSGNLNLMREYVATLNALPEWRRFGGADFFSYTQRHFTERVAYGLPIRDLMREVPLIWLVPEIMLLTAKESL